MGASPQFWILNSLGKIMTRYLRGMNKFLSYRTNSYKMLNANSGQKVSHLQGLYFLRYLECLSFVLPRFRPFRQDTHEKLQNTSEAIGYEILVCLTQLDGTLYMFLAQGISLSLLGRGADEKIQKRCPASGSVDEWLVQLLCYLQKSLKYFLT